MTEKTEISELPPDEIIARAKKALRIGGDTHTWDDVVDGLVRGSFQAHWNLGGLIVTEIIQYPRKRALHCFVVAGELSAVLALQPRLQKFARAENCDLITATGRIGWERILPTTGWRKAHSVFVLEVEYE